MDSGIFHDTKNKEIEGMTFQGIVGVDMSKEHFDFCWMASDFSIRLQHRVDNQEQAIEVFIQDFMVAADLTNLGQVVLVVEHTGIYTQLLLKAWLSHAGRVSLVAANKVSNLLGGKVKWAEKTDQLDAQRLAEYGIRYFDKLDFYQAPKSVMVLLKSLQRQRERLIQVINALQVPLQEAQTFENPSIHDQLTANQQASIQALQNDLKAIDQQLKSIFENDPQLNHLIKLITSVSGVGVVTAREIIIATQAFERFTPQEAKAFARYAGVVPLRHQSGKMNKRPRTSKQAHKKIRSLLTMCARSLIKSKAELGLYYHRKIKEGKPSRLVINNMKNKLILRIFAVVRNQTMYQKNLNILLD